MQMFKLLNNDAAELEALLPALGECLRRPGAEAAQARLHWITDA